MITLRLELEKISKFALFENYNIIGKHWITRNRNVTLRILANYRIMKTSVLAMSGSNTKHPQCLNKLYLKTKVYKCVYKNLSNIIHVKINITWCLGRKLINTEDVYKQNRVF